MDLGSLFDGAEIDGHGTSIKDGRSAQFGGKSGGPPFIVVSVNMVSHHVVAGEGEEVCVAALILICPQIELVQGQFVLLKMIEEGVVFC